MTLVNYDFIFDYYRKNFWFIVTSYFIVFSLLVIVHNQLFGLEQFLLRFWWAYTPFWISHKAWTQIVYATLFAFLCCSLPVQYLAIDINTFVSYHIGRSLFFVLVFPIGIIFYSGQLSGIFLFYVFVGLTFFIWETREYWGPFFEVFESEQYSGPFILAFTFLCYYGLSAISVDGECFNLFYFFLLASIYWGRLIMLFHTLYHCADTYLQCIPGIDIVGEKHVEAPLGTRVTVKGHLKIDSSTLKYGKDAFKYFKNSKFSHYVIYGGLAYLGYKNQIHEARNQAHEKVKYSQEVAEKADAAVNKALTQIPVCSPKDKACMEQRSLFEEWYQSKRQQHQQAYDQLQQAIQDADYYDAPVRASLAVLKDLMNSN